MRICFPTDTDDGIKSKVCAHFGSAPCFTIYDTEKDEIEILDNLNEDHEHCNYTPMQSLKGKNINMVISGGMGGAIMKLNDGGIRVFRAIPGTVEDMIEQYKLDKLEEITVHNACNQHNCD